MARKLQAIKIEEIPGNQFPNLNAAQQAARGLIASELAGVVRRLIDQGVLEIRNGCILPKE